MWEKIGKWLFDKVPYFLVGLLAVVIIVINFPKGEWLIGWDNLSTELNVGMNISRNLSGVWQEYQGLGLLAGMAHMADLVRLVVQSLLSYIVPTMYLRSGMNLSMLLIGSLGMVNLVRILFPTKKHVSWTASLAAVFYLFNIGTVQNFWAVFEPYAWTYGLVPWLIAYFVDYLASGKKKSLLLFAFASLLATPMAYLQTIFVVYFCVLICLSFGYIFDFRRIRFTDKLRRIAIVLAVVLGVNSFWLMPQAYFFVTSADVTVNAKMNMIATPEVELSNQSKGALIDVMRMEGYWLDLHDVTEQGNFENLMKPWAQHLGSSTVQYLQYILIGFVCLGLVGMYVFNYSWKWSISLGTVATIGLMQNDNAPLGFGWLGLYKLFPIVDQVFRSSFTKVIVFESILFSILFGMCFLILIDLMKKLFKKYYFVLVFLIFMVMVGCGVYVGLPVLSGEMVYKRIQQDFPLEYVDLDNYFKTVENGRILKLPASSLWGWQYNEWGYDGSGFLWYGIEQPILDRAFDVWSPYNETFYNQFSTALYGGDKDDVARVLTQYDVRYVLLDESVIAPGQDKEILRIEVTKKMAIELGWSEKFHEGFLTVWEVPITRVPIGSDLPADESAGWALPLRSDPGLHGVTAPSSYTVISGDTGKVREDVIYGDVGTYVEKIGAVVYPFAGLMREKIEGVEYGEGRVTLSFEETPPAFGGPTWPSATSPVEESPQLVIPGWKVGDIVRINFENNEAVPVYYVNGEDGLPAQAGPRFLGKEKPEEGKSYIVARVSEGVEWREYLQEQKFEIINEKLEIEVAGEPQIYDFGKTGQGSVGNCDVLKRGYATKSQISNSQILKLGQTQYVADGRGAACDYVVMGELDTRLSYLMRVQGENKEGRSLKYFLYNTGSKRNDIEYLLGKGRFDQTFGLLPWSWDGTYTLNIETRSFGQRAENIVEPVEVRWFPMEQIAGAKVVSTHGETPPASGVPTWPLATSPVEESPREQSNLVITEFKKTGTWLYGVKVEGSGLIKLSQGYDEGWVGVQITNPKFSNSKILLHTKVDGWANGWILRQAQDKLIWIFYWPQLLEYLGFGILGVTIIALVCGRKQS